MGAVDQDRAVLLPSSRSDKCALGPQQRLRTISLRFSSLFATASGRNRATWAALAAVVLLGGIAAYRAAIPGQDSAYVSTSHSSRHDPGCTVVLRGDDRGASGDANGALASACASAFKKSLSEAHEHRKERAQFLAANSGVSWTDDASQAQSRDKLAVFDPFFADWACPSVSRVGGFKDGGKLMCGAAPADGQPASAVVAVAPAAQEDCLIYSIGSNGDFSFEEAIVKRMGRPCEVHIFDPTWKPSSFETGQYDDTCGADSSATSPDQSQSKGAAERWQTVMAANTVPKGHNGVPKHVNYHVVGLAHKYMCRSKLGFHGPLMRLADIMRALGHEGRRIDIFKVDCEGCEWHVFNDDLWAGPDCGGRPGSGSGIQIGQLLIEVHAGVTIDDSTGHLLRPKPLDGSDVVKFFDNAARCGMLVFSKELNYFAPMVAIEYSLVDYRTADAVWRGATCPAVAAPLISSWGPSEGIGSADGGDAAAAAAPTAPAAAAEAPANASAAAPAPASDSSSGESGRRRRQLRMA